VGYLNGNAFNGGQGVAERHPLLTSTQFVIRDQLFGLSALSEDFRTHVYQRVVMQYGFAGEAGFVTFVGYADGEIQQFEVAGESGARTLSFDTTNAADQGALTAALRGSDMATAFSRATSFDPQFIDSNQVLPTSAVARRAADFFMFENASASDSNAIRDLTVESFDIKNVFTLGTQGALDVPRDPAPVEPPIVGLAAPPDLLANPTELVRSDVELAAIQERIVEVAIYRVFYEDANANGQAEESELPTEDEVLAAEISEDEAAAPASEMEPGKRLKLGTVKTASGGSPTAEDIEALKNEFLNDPQRPSGAYSIIEKGLDDKETVLDIFSVRDSVQAVEDSDQPLIRPATPEELQQLQLEEGAGVAPAANDGASYPNDTTDQALPGEWRDQSTPSRFANASLIASSLWLVRAQGSTNTDRTCVALAETITPQTERAPIDFGRRARRSRRWQRKRTQ
jgi:hypothetical protein